MHIIIVRNNSNSAAIEASLILGAYLDSQDIAYTVFNSDDLRCLHQSNDVKKLLDDDVSMVVSLGGDGTLLLCARQVGFSGVPILGINYGTLGFLVNGSDAGVVEPVSASLSGEIIEQSRSNLNICVVCEGEEDPFSQDEESSSHIPCKHEFFALNEVALTRGVSGTIIDFSFGIAGVPIADMRADGLVVSTATGSTAYALSAGGPLVAPGFSGLVVVPIAPHSLRSRAIITNPEDIVDIEVKHKALSEAEETLFIDGITAQLPSAIKRIYVKRGEAPTKILRYQAMNFYERSAEVFF